MEKLTKEEAQYLRGFAEALQSMMFSITGNNTIAKHYDPFTYDENVHIILSYAFDLKSGGRKHELSEFESVEEIKELMLQEATNWCKESSALEEKEARTPSIVKGNHKPSHNMINKVGLVNALEHDKIQNTFMFDMLNILGIKEEAYDFRRLKNSNWKLLLSEIQLHELQRLCVETRSKLEWFNKKLPPKANIIVNEGWAYDIVKCYLHLSL